MKNIDIRIVERFLNNTCTPDEARQVLEWFDTPEGQQYLDRELDSDIEQFGNTNLHPIDPNLNSEELFRSIKSRIKPAKRNIYSRKSRVLTPILRVAAVLLLSFIGSVYYFYNYYEEAEQGQTAEVTPVHYETGDDQQKELTLTDGTTIRLNSNSQVWIASNFSGDTREVRMEGEAYFDVARDKEKPFIIHTERASIRVLGTAFNVKSFPSEQNIQVAVVEGSVSVHSTNEQKEEQSVVLSKGQFGYLDQDKITVENFGVENYLAWMKGRLVFEDLALNQVCIQLTRLYSVQCGFDDETLKNLSLTTNISGDSLEKVLSVISLSLDISYTKAGNKVIWFDKKE